MTLVRSISLGIVLVSASVRAAGAQACPDPRALIHGMSGPIAAVRYLADDALEGRMSGTPGERCAGDYIAAEFRRLGLAPAGDSGGWFQWTPLASAVNPHAPGGMGRNVLARLPGADPALAGEVIVIGAHYDHLGHGGSFSLSPGERAIHNGADDNASGVAALLDVARRLSRGPKPARTIIFAAFTGEEIGLLGSAHLARSTLLPQGGVRAMLNMDMVGRLGAGPLIVYGTDTAEEWKEMVDRAASAEGLATRGGGDGFGASDQTSFFAAGIPVLHFFTNVHEDYHKPSDDWEKIDAAGLSKVAAVVERVVRDVAGRPAALTFRQAAPRPQAAVATPGYGAYLGSIPDFAPVERGVRLSGVRAGSPAEKAGIRAGDVLVRMGTHEVADLMGLTNALRAHKPGDTVDVVYLREGREATTRVTLESRGGS
jgi:Peptidase family M28/PDZ domain